MASSKRRASRRRYLLSTDGIGGSSMSPSPRKAMVGMAAFVFLSAAFAVMVSWPNSAPVEHSVEVRPTSAPKIASTAPTGMTTARTAARITQEAADGSTAQSTTDRSGRIEGRVLLSDGRVPLFPVTVFAWADRSIPDYTAICRRELPLQVRADANGRFALIGLDAGRSYQVASGGPGWLSDTDIRTRPGTEEPIDLRMWQTFGSIVRVVTSDGSPPPPSDLARMVRPGAPVPDSSSLTQDIQFALAGIDRLADTDWREVAFVFRAPAEAVMETHIEHKVHMDVFGYRQAQAVVHLRPIVDQIHVETIVLERDCVGFGALALSLDLPEAPPEFDHAVGSGSYLRLTSADSGRRIDMPLDEIGAMRLIRGVPSGMYDLDIRLHKGHVSRALSGVYVAINQTTECGFDLSGCSVLRISAESDFFPAVVRVSSHERPEAFNVYLTGPEVVISSLRAGRFRLTLVSSYLSERLAKSIDVNLAAGTASEIAWPDS